MLFEVEDMMLSPSFGLPSAETLLSENRLLFDDSMFIPLLPGNPPFPVVVTVLLFNLFEFEDRRDMPSELLPLVNIRLSKALFELEFELSFMPGDCVFFVVIVLFFMVFVLLVVNWMDGELLPEVVALLFSIVLDELEARYMFCAREPVLEILLRCIMFQLDDCRYMSYP